MDYIVTRNDITLMDVDAIVLPANSKLKEGSGASTAIFRKAGREELTKACADITRKKSDISVGTAVPTLGFDLEATYIIHAVVPQWRDGHSNEYELLSSAYYSSLELADLLSCESVAIPLLAAGNNGFDLDLAIEIALKSIDAFEPSNRLTEVHLVIYGMRAADKFRKLHIPFSEEIDEAYVLGHNESYHPQQRKPKRGLKNVAKKYLDEAIKQAGEYFSDPENVKKIVQFGIGIVVDRIK